MFICTTKSIRYLEYIYTFVVAATNKQQRPTTSSEIRRFWLRATRSIFANWYLEKQRYLKLSFGECAPDESNLENYPNSKPHKKQKLNTFSEADRKIYSTIQLLHTSVARELSQLQFMINIQAE